MKPIQSSATPLPNEHAHVLVFGAHPDDVEFGCGGIVAKEVLGRRKVHVVICSRGEAGTFGTAEGRVKEAEKGAGILGVTVEFLELDGDARLEERREHAIKLAGVIRRVRPRVVLAPTLVEGQHPDHWRLGRLVRDAGRLARYGGMEELKGAGEAHAIEGLFFYAVGPEGECRGGLEVLVDVTEVLEAWVLAMSAHESQASTREYVELQMRRARVNGLRAGVGYAIALWPGEALVVDSLEAISRGARKF